MPFLGPVPVPARPKLPLPSGLGAGMGLGGDVTGMAVSVPGVPSASASPQGRESPPRALSRPRGAGAMRDPELSQLGRAGRGLPAVPAVVVGMKIPGGNPAFRQDKSRISPPGMGQG